MNKDEIKIGDIVRLKSGGPSMTVDDNLCAQPGRAPTAYCVWFDGSAFKHARIAVASLTHLTGFDLATLKG